jgi:hypothetical protein
MPFVAPASCRPLLNLKGLPASPDFLSDSMVFVRWPEGRGARPGNNKECPAMAGLKSRPSLSVVRNPGEKLALRQPSKDSSISLLN